MRVRVVPTGPPKESQLERELVMTGIGGQGVQLASSVLATAALAEGLEVQLFGSYAGMMRGGATEATIVFGDAPIEAPPTLSDSWSVILMHHEHSERARACMRPGSVVLTNSTVLDLDVDRDGRLVFEVPATDIAIEAGHAMSASMVMMGAYAALTGIVRVSSLERAAASALPPYREQHRDLNARAITAGASAVSPLAAPAWVTGAAR